MLCKCDVNLLTEVSSVRLKLACFTSHLMKLKVSTEVITLTWEMVALSVPVDRAGKVSGLWDAIASSVNG